MPSIRACPLPEGALLSRYAQAGAYTDCFTTEIARPISHAAYVEAFYTTALFKLERFLLTWFVAKPSTDTQARALASGASSTFAAWHVEERSTDQLLVCDYRGYTRSWLMIGPSGDGGASLTRLYFGTAVVPARDRVSGRAKWSFPFKALLGFHKLYSRALLHAARCRVERIGRP
ncbi:MAG TPA: hypothetical protein VH722_21190 [Alphaproteobacteria bacterium]|jgi:hypothetical protein|nr:hypothetical protein [Alphaproteobacteria bacterium]